MTAPAQDSLTAFLQSALPDASGATLMALAAEAKSITLAAGEKWIPPHDGEAHVCLLQDGLAVLRRHPDADAEALDAGQGFGLPARREQSRTVEVIAAAPSVLVQIAESVYPDAHDGLPLFSELMTSLNLAGVDREQELAEQHAERATQRGRVQLLHLPVSELMSRNLVTVNSGTRIQDAAVRMAERRISSVPVVDGERLLGLLTEADLTARVVAQGSDIVMKVDDVMTLNPPSVAHDALLFDALDLITRHGVAQIPVLDGERLLGIVTQTDIVRQQTASAVYLIGDIERAGDAEAIARSTAEVPRLLMNLIDAGASSLETAHVITSITDAATRRLIALTLEQQGPAPVAWAWLACGSQGRQEQTGATDQDNCLFLADDYDEKRHGAWFKDFATAVCTGLDRAGYRFCPGEMMAMTERWRQPLRVWKQYFQQWIEAPGTEAQMLASVMFDLRVIDGDAGLLPAVKAGIAEKARSNSIFLAHMVSNSLKHRPPLGLFGRIATERRGEFRHRIDLKHGATVPIIDLARVHALSLGSSEVGTLARLRETGKGAALSPAACRDLQDSFEFINLLRLQHQAEQARQRAAPDNYVDPDALGRLEREQLRDSLALIKSIQSALGSRQGALG